MTAAQLIDFETWKALCEGCYACDPEEQNGFSIALCLLAGKEYRRHVRVALSLYDNAIWEYLEDKKVGYNSIPTELLKQWQYESYKELTRLIS